MRSSGRATAAILLLALLLPPIVPIAQAKEMDLEPVGEDDGSEPPYAVSFAMALRPGVADSWSLTEFLVQCQGPCSAARGGPELDFRFRAPNSQHVDLAFPSTASTTFPQEGSPIPWHNYTFAVQLPRSHAPEFRVHLYEAGGREYVTGWQALPGVRGGTATFAYAGATTAYRGDAPTVKSTSPAYLANPASFRADPDRWDGLAAAGGAPQTLTWSLGRAGVVAVPVTQPADITPLAPTLATLTRNACMVYTVTVDDRAGQAAEGAAYRDRAPGAFFDPTAAAPALQTGPATYTVEQVCVANNVPRFTASFQPDPLDAAMGVFTFGSVIDQDHARGFDKLVFTLWDHQSRTAPGAQVLGTWDWDALTAERRLQVPLGSLVDGSALCLMDLERNAIVGGLPRQEVPNLAQPVCASFAKTPSPTLARSGVSRLIVEAGPEDRTWTVTSGALHDTHRSLPFDPADPEANLPHLASILRGLLNEGIVPGSTTVAAFTIPNLPADDEVNRLVAEASARGILVIVPAGLPSPLAAVTPKWEVRGLAAHPDALTVGAASEDGTRVRSDSAHGPSPLLRQKPDVTVRTQDALAGAAAQSAAVLYAADLALWYELRGLTEPDLVKGLVMQQAKPVHGGGSLGTASATGAGALDPAGFTLDPAKLDRASLPLVDLDDEAVLRAAGAAAVVPLPVVTPNALLDIGVVNRGIAKQGSLALENPNGLLRATLDTPIGSLAALLPAGTDPVAPSRTTPTVTVNVTFYSLLDVLAHNLTDATLARELRDRVADLDASTPAALGGPERDAILASLAAGDPPRGWAFIPETTIAVPPSTYQTLCRAPSLTALRYHVQAGIAYLGLVGAPSGELQARLQDINGIAWDNCAPALTRLHLAVDAITSILDARAAATGEPYPGQLGAAIAADRAALDLLAAKSTGRAVANSLTWMPLATDPARTAEAPVGPYVGVVRITTHGQCAMDLQGDPGACRDSTDYALATLTLADHTSFVLRDRAGRPMPGRLVTLQSLPAPVNCAGPAPDAPGVMMASLAASQLFSGAASFAAPTGADGVVRFPWVPSGYYDLHDGFSGFPIHGTWGGDPTASRESTGFREADCHLPVLVRGDLDAALAAGLGAAAGLPCVKTATKGLPVVGVLRALDARAAGQPGPCATGLPGADAQAAASTVRAALAAAFGPEAWQIVFPQVQQARLADTVQALDVATTDYGDPSPTAWSFSRSGTRVAAAGSLLTQGAAAFQYSYPLPPNEEVAVKWKFGVDLSNTAGLAVFTLRDDLPGVLRALASRNPPNATAAAADLASLLAGSATGGTSACAPAAHYRILPLAPLGGSLNGSADPEGETTLEASALGTHATVSRYFRFHTRECPRATAHAAFLFFPLPATPQAQADPQVGFAVEEQQVWTWTGVGTPAVDCPGAWCLLKLAGEGAMAQPVGMATLDQSVVKLGIPFDPKVEGWDSFVDIMDHARALGGTLPAAVGDLLLHPNAEDSPDMGAAPDVPETVATWLAEAQRSAFLDASGMPLEGPAAQSLALGGLWMPDRNGPPSGDHVQLEWVPAGTGPTRFAPPAGAQDASPNQAHSQGVAATPLDSGRFAGGYRLNGHSSFITVPQSGAPMDAGTVMMWVKPTSRIATMGRLFYHQHGGVANQLAVGLDTAGHVYHQTGNGAPNVVLSSATLPLNQWSHIAVTWQPGAMRIFVNGQPSGMVPESWGVRADYTVTMIGNSPNDIHTGGFLGSVDEVREYDVALDAAAIASLKDFPYATPSGQPSADPANAPRLIGHERFVYAMDGPVLAPEGGHVRQTPQLGTGAGFAAAADPTRTLGFQDLLADALGPLAAAPRLVAPSWANHPSFAPTASAAAYTRMLHVPRAAAAQHPGEWTVLESHPRAPPLPGWALPPEAQYPTPLLPWVPGTNTERYALGALVTVDPASPDPVRVQAQVPAGATCGAVSLPVTARPVPCRQIGASL